MTKFDFVKKSLLAEHNNQIYTEITGDKNTDIINMKKMLSKKVIMIGEAHDDEYCQWFIEEVLKHFNPDFFLTEHTQYLDVYPDEFDKRLETLGKDGLPYNRYTKYWLEVGAKYNIPFIGMDYLPPDGELKTFEKVVYGTPGKEYDLKDMNASFKLRESRMIEVLEKYVTKGKVLLQVGDTHLRSEPDKNFDSSPLTDYAIANSKTVGMFRLAYRYQECH